MPSFEFPINFWSYLGHGLPPIEFLFDAHHRLLRQLLNFWEFQNTNVEKRPSNKNHNEGQAGDQRELGYSHWLNFTQWFFPLDPHLEKTPTFQLVISKYIQQRAKSPFCWNFVSTTQVACHYEDIWTKLPKMMFAGGANEPGEENSLENRETLVTLP